MPSEHDMQVIEFDRFELPQKVSSRRIDRERRRFMTLMVPVGAEARHHGGIGYVVKAYNTLGEAFALKRMRMKDAMGASSNRAAQLEASLRKEYEVHSAIAHCGHIPLVYGYAFAGDEPAIVMEWIDGVTLEEALKSLTDAEGRASLKSVVGIGVGCLVALRSIQNLVFDIVHRDISPANIMLKTNRESLDDQLAKGVFDVVLIDFGSAVAQERLEVSFTATEGLLRGATPDYAPPEMLGHDTPDVLRARLSPSVDIYALCSVLYRLYTGHAPFDLGAAQDIPLYHLKATNVPADIDVRKPDDGTLAGLIMSGLGIDQKERPSAQDLLDGLCEWACTHGDGAWAARLKEVASELAAAADDSAHQAVNEGAYVFSSTPGFQLIVKSKESGGRVSAELEELSSPKRLRGISRRTLVAGGLATLALVSVAGLSLASYMSKQSPVHGRVDEFIPGMHLMRVKQNGRWGFVSTSSKWIIEPVFANAIGNFSYETPAGKHGMPLAFVQDDSGLVGFVTPVDRPENPTIPYRYANAGMFCNDMACAQDSETGGWGLINSSGEYVLNPIYANIMAVGKTESGSYITAVSDDGTAWRYVMFTGDAEDADYPADVFDACFAGAGVVGQGLLPVSLGDTAHYGFLKSEQVRVDDEDAWAVKPVHRNVRTYSEGLAAFSDDGVLWGYLGLDGSVRIEPCFSEAFEFTGLGMASAKDPESGLWGFIGKDGEWASSNVAPRFSELGNLEVGDDGTSRRGVAAAKEPATGLWGFVGIDGEWLIEPAFEDAGIGASAGDVRMLAIASETADA